MPKAIIMTVDDEPEVLNAVARDLRGRFRSDYRIMKAGSGAEALEAVRTLKERDVPIALFLVDERMPAMSGTEFLREARGLYPEARKVLLTAYADTQTAITGINDVGLDHYLMKPWDPPEDHLFPVLEDLLSDWTAHHRPRFDGIRVAGTRWSPESYQVRDFLSRSQVPYQWVDLEIESDVRTLAEELSPGLEALPVILFPDGRTIVGPGLTELAERIGQQTRATLPFYDLIIVGGGPAGLAASVYGASEGLRTVLIEDDVPGGQAGTSSMIENYLGFPSGVAGGDLARRAVTQARRFGAEVVAPQVVESVRVEDPYRIVRLKDGTELSGYAVLVSTGMEVRRLQAPGVEELTGRGVYYGAALSEASACLNSEVIVVGGANSAGQAALLLARYAKKLTILVRGEGLSASMSQYLIQRIDAQENIEVLTRTQLVSVQGGDRLETVTLRTGDDEPMSREASHVFVFIGARPHSGVVADLVMRDDQGFILTGRDLVRGGKRPERWTPDREPYFLETSVPGIFAAGDVRRGSTKRVASAVGEGSSAVGMIHNYLEGV
ncbi:MAG: FAD-dependent oxidoreductase [Gemmatimonadota bacterium]|jgi:thioredoxin reductase (NADPH)